MPVVEGWQFTPNYTLWWIHISWSMTLKPLEQHCTMTLHFKDQIRWLVTHRKKPQSMCISELFLTSLCLQQCSWTGRNFKSLQHRESSVMETSNCIDYWRRNTIVSKWLPFSKSNITIWNQRLNTCAPVDRTSDFWSLKRQWKTWTLMKTWCTSAWQGLLLQLTGFYLPVWIRVTKKCGN